MSACVERCKATFPMEAIDTSWITINEVSQDLGGDQDTAYHRGDSIGKSINRLGHFWKFQLTGVDACFKSGEAKASKGTAPKMILIDDGTFLPTNRVH